VNPSEEENEPEGKLRKKKVRRVFRPEQGLKAKTNRKVKELELNRRY